MKNHQKGFIIPLLIAIVAILAVGGGYYYAKKISQPVGSGLPAKSFDNASTTQNSSVADISDWQTYTDAKYGFTFKYPKNMTVNTLHVSGPSADSSGEDQFYIKELDNARLVEVSVPSASANIKNTEDLLTVMQKTQTGFTNAEKDFYNLGNAVFHSNPNQQDSCGDGSYETIIHNGKAFTFMDYSNCTNASQISEILNTFKFITAAAQVSSVKDNSSNGPVITSISPSQGKVGQDITVHGSGFGNLDMVYLKKNLAPFITIHISSSTLSFTIPSDITVPQGANEPVTMQMTPGDYSIIVGGPMVNHIGPDIGRDSAISNMVTFTVTGN